jgi:hypothetical protein
VRIAATGDAEIQGEVVQGFITAMATGLMLVLAVLILLFGSVFQPITILLSLPLSFGGVVIALLATDKPVSMPVYIGLLMLMGIVTKNAIMLVDFAVEEMARGKDRRTALLEAGRKRARPIVMTTIAMAAGMMPSAYGVGDGGEFRAPMAIAVIGGLIVSTVLSLVFVPSFYAVMDDLSRDRGGSSAASSASPRMRAPGSRSDEHATPGEASAKAMARASCRRRGWRRSNSGGGWLRAGRALALDRAAIGLGQPLQYGVLRARGAEMEEARLLHESLPERRAAIGEQFGADRHVLAHRQEAPAPIARRGDDGHQRNPDLGQAVDALLLVGGAVAARDLPDQALQPVGEDVRGYALVRFRQELARMPAVTEHHVAQDDRAPAVPGDFERQVDRAGRAAGLLRQSVQ